MGVFFVRGDKVLWSGSRLITLSPWPCCRGGVFVCTGCVYLDTVTWTGREVTITIRLLYPRSILRQAPIMGLQCPTVFGHKGNPHHPAGQWGQPRQRQNIFAQVDGPTAPSAFRPRFFCQRMTAAFVFGP